MDANLNMHTVECEGRPLNAVPFLTMKRGPGGDLERSGVSVRSPTARSSCVKFVGRAEVAETIQSVLLDVERHGTRSMVLPNRGPFGRGLGPSRGGDGVIIGLKHGKSDEFLSVLERWHCQETGVHHSRSRRCEVE